MERNLSERAAFLDEACGGDEELHREVESLLAHMGLGHAYGVLGKKDEARGVLEE